MFHLRTSRLLRGSLAASQGLRFCATHANGLSQQSVTGPSWKQLRRHFVCCAVPMVGFGMMDNTILIHAGDIIERHFGVKFGLTGLQSAACGQVFSDLCGVCFGGVIETISRGRLSPPGFTTSQLQLRLTQLVGTAGAGLGVVTGCLIGMCNLFLIDVDEAERLKQAAKLETIFKTAMESAVDTMNCPIGTCFLVDEAKGELWTRATAGYQGIVRRKLDEKLSIAAWVAIHGQPSVVDDAQADPRYCPDIQEIIGTPARSVITYPVFSHSDGKSVVAVLQFFNKPTGFSDEDCRVMNLLSVHFSIFMANCE